VTEVATLARTRQDVRRVINPMVEAENGRRGRDECDFEEEVQEEVEDEEEAEEVEGCSEAGCVDELVSERYDRDREGEVESIDSKSRAVEKSICGVSTAQGRRRMNRGR